MSAWIRRWLALDAAVRNHVKEGLVTALQDDLPPVRSTAALVISKIAAFELPAQGWPNLIASLMAILNQQPPKHGARQVSAAAQQGGGGTGRTGRAGERGHS